jgi:hypothetical protein
MKGTDPACFSPTNSRIDEVDNIVKARDTSISLQNSPVDIFSCLPVVRFSLLFRRLADVVVVAIGSTLTYNDQSSQHHCFVCI